MKPFSSLYEFTSFNTSDVVEIGTTAVEAFISTFKYVKKPSKGFGLRDYGCGEITDSVEKMV